MPLILSPSRTNPYTSKNEAPPPESSAWSSAGAVDDDPGQLDRECIDENPFSLLPLAISRAASSGIIEGADWLAESLRDAGIGENDAAPVLLRYSWESKRDDFSHVSDVCSLADAVVALFKAYRGDTSEIANGRFPIKAKRETRIGLRFTPLAELLVETAEDQPFLVDRLLPAGGSSILAGEPKAGKSTFARSLIADVVQGRTFLGRATISGPVLYLCLEDKRSEVQEHFRCLLGETPSQFAPLLIHTGPAPGEGERGFDELEFSILRFGATLAVIDVLHRFLRLPDINDYSAVSPPMEELTDIARRTNCHILVLHHAGKGMDRHGINRVLGSTALAGAVDTAMFYSRRGKSRTFEVSHLRYGEEIPETIMELDPVTRRVTGGHEYSTRAEVTIRQKIRQFLTDAGSPVSEDDVRSGVQGDNGKIGTVLRQMYEEREVGRSGTGKRASPFKYSILVSTI